MDPIDAAPPLDHGRYRLLRVLGIGGMAAVYEGHDARLDVRRAIKILDPTLFSRERILGRFEAEARTMARLVHRHIVTVHDMGIDGERAYIVMEMVEGGTLQDRLQAGGVRPVEAAGWMLAILEALSAAHAAGVVHRDLKPQNVMVARDGTIKLGDFGIARLVDESGRSATRTGASLGTPAYMPPEQKTDARTAGPEADVYAAGATLFALVTGREPQDLYVREIKAQLLPLVPGPLAPIVDRATRYRPEDRYPSVGAMAEAIAGVLPHLSDEPATWAPAPVASDSDTYDATGSTLGDADTPAETSLQAPTTRTRGWLLPIAAAGLMVATLTIAAAAAAGGYALLAMPQVLPQGSVAPTPLETPPIAASEITASEPSESPTASPVPAPAVPVAGKPVSTPGNHATVATAAPTIAAPATAAPATAAPATSAPGTEPPASVVAAAPEPPGPADDPAVPPEPKVPCRFSSTAPGSVLLDGATLGRTPYTGECPAGRHQVTLDPDGDQPPFVRTFAFQPPGRVNYCHDFEAGRPCR